jgi:3-oxo-5alpha-steroid 4-dehydrogenase
VVLTTGGFVDNPTMLAHHAPVLVGHGNVSDGGDDGSGIQLAAAFGAATRRMGAVEVALTAVPAMACAGMLVNSRGERFINEDVYPGHYSHAALLTQPGPWWVILDQAGFEALSPQDSWGLQPQHAAESVTELEDDLGIPAGGLATTLDVYNRDAATGSDSRFHKAEKWLRVLEPPYAAFDPGALSAATGGPASGISGFTLGGLHTTVDGNVLHLSGIPIEGLFAAGRAASGIHGDNYISGTSLGDGTFFGRRAGRKASQPRRPQ